ncbi:hypothetical protein Peur_026546 [Populus x canadensis]
MFVSRNSLFGKPFSKLSCVCLPLGKFVNGKHFPVNRKYFPVNENTFRSTKNTFQSKKNLKQTCYSSTSRNLWTWRILLHLCETAYYLTNKASRQHHGN